MLYFTCHHLLLVSLYLLVLEIEPVSSIFYFFSLRMIHLIHPYRLSS